MLLPNIALSKKTMLWLWRFVARMLLPSSRRYIQRKDLQQCSQMHTKKLEKEKERVKGKWDSKVVILLFLCRGPYLVRDPLRNRPKSGAPLSLLLLLLLLLAFPMLVVVVLVVMRRCLLGWTARIRRLALLSMPPVLPKMTRQGKLPSLGQLVLPLFLVLLLLLLVSFRLRLRPLRRLNKRSLNALWSKGSNQRIERQCPVGWRRSRVQPLAPLSVREKLLLVALRLFQLRKQRTVVVVTAINS
jgi:hypothetical protein